MQDKSRVLDLFRGKRDFWSGRQTLHYALTSTYRGYQFDWRGIYLEPADVSLFNKAMAALRLEFEDSEVCTFMINSLFSFAVDSFCLANLQTQQQRKAR